MTNSHSHSELKSEMKISILIGQKVFHIHCILHSIVAWNVFVLTQRYNYLTATNKSFLTFFFTGCCPSGFTTFIRMMNPHCSTQLCSIVDLKIFCLLLVWRRLHNHLTRYFYSKLMFLDRLLCPQEGPGFGGSWDVRGTLER